LDVGVKDILQFSGEVWFAELLGVRGAEVKFCMDDGVMLECVVDEGAVAEEVPALFGNILEEYVRAVVFVIGDAVVVR
jgi:hypothetical protein